MRISFLSLLFSSLFFAQIVSAAENDSQAKSALLKAIDAEDTATVKKFAGSGNESIDRDDALQEKIYRYLEGEDQRVLLAKQKAKADAVARNKAHAKARRDALAAKKAAEEKRKMDVLAAAKAKKRADEKKRQQAAAEKKVPPVKAIAKTPEAIAPKAKTAPAIAVAVAATPVPAAAVKAEEGLNAPLIISDMKLIGTWKQIGSNKVSTLVVNDDSSFMLKEVEDDGTLTLTGTWESDQSSFDLDITKVQHNIHSRETDINHFYKVEKLSNRRLVLRDQRDRIAYDLKR
ncbi:MAG: hypothetical protein MUP09_07420 [Thiovulaceae bacterium]|nr:hypothetical protein [Sulfurimonadaceae bacterium]